MKQEEPWRTEPCLDCEGTQFAKERIAEFNGGSRNFACPGDMCLCTDCGALLGIDANLHFTPASAEQIDHFLGNDFMLDKQAYYRDRRDAKGGEPNGKHMLARKTAREKAEGPPQIDSQTFLQKLKARLKRRKDAAKGLWACRRT